MNMGKVAVYVRESRDDAGENFETIETQKELLLDFAKSSRPDQECSVYIDDNVSGSAFDRPGLELLKKDAAEGRIDTLLLKDLSRLGRNNAKTLMLIDFFEECGVRIITLDGKYDSLKDNDTVGIETWFNERYVRDISKKIRASLRFKISRGEYIGHAPYGYKKSDLQRNKLVVDRQAAEVVKEIFRLYAKGFGYASIAAMLNEKGIPSPGGGRWNHVTVGRITGNRVYVGDTVQGISERISFKSKKARALPQEDWVITENTHEAIIPREVFLEIQKLKEERRKIRMPHKKKLHLLRGMVYCGDCGSMMYARIKSTGVAYICSNYFRKGRKSCKSHLIYEADILEYVLNELEAKISDRACLERFAQMRKSDDIEPEWVSTRLKKLEKQLSAKFRQQELIYMDRLEGRITVEFFEKQYKLAEERIAVLKDEIEALKRSISFAGKEDEDAVNGKIVGNIMDWLRSGAIDNHILKSFVKKITVMENMNETGQKTNSEGRGTVFVEFRFANP
jgi:site-specific DNA recombinase